MACQQGTVYWPAQDAPVPHPAFRHWSNTRFQARTRCGSTASEFLPDTLPVKSVAEGVLDHQAVYAKQSEEPAEVFSTYTFYFDERSFAWSPFWLSAVQRQAALDLPMRLIASAD